MKNNPSTPPGNFYDKRPENIAFIEGFSKYNCSTCDSNKCYVYIVWKDEPPSFLMTQCVTCGNATRYKITEINDLGKIAVGEIDTFKALHPEAKLEDAIKFAQDEDDKADK